MITMQGKGVSCGIAMGIVRIYTRDEISIKRVRTEDTAKEIHRYRAAKEMALSELNELYKKALKEIGEEDALIFGMHCMMLEDPDYNNSVEGIIRRQLVNAEYAVTLTTDNLRRLFDVMEDSYIRERSADVQDVSQRVLKCLTNHTAENRRTEENSVICSDDLSPSETMQLDRNNVLAFCTARGSATSHTAILARTMGIPAVTSLGDALLQLSDGDEIIVDGGSGMIYVNPDDVTRAAMAAKHEEDLRIKHRLHSLRDRDNITQDGHKISIYANISGIADIPSALDNGAGGIGLLRSEFLYLDRSVAPTEDEQVEIYRKALEQMSGKRVIIRTLDIGADKQAKCFKHEMEENPALGIRGIRFCFAHPEVFRVQLRALFRASVYGKLAIMFPMVSSIEDVRMSKAVIAQIKRELEQQGIPYCKEVEIGAMIETPGAVMISDLLARELDFFSIGTNDLTQYTLAADRQNPYLEQYFNTRHIALMRMIYMTTVNAHKSGAWIGVCGELAADTSLTETFLAMGIDELSVNPSAILPLREKVISLDMKRKQQILDELGMGIC